jgi:hypothetical protein
MIRVQSEKLLALSASLESWNKGPYAACIRIVNTETIASLRRYWRNYSSPRNSTVTLTQKFNSAIEKVYNRYYRSVRPVDALTKSARILWDVSRDRCDHDPPCRFINPLFAYSDCAGNRFAIHQDTSHLAGFHIVASYATLTPGTLYDDRHVSGDPEFEISYGALTTAVMEYRSWCNAFRQATQRSKENKGLQIRFFIGDAVAFCMALHELREPVDVANCYSRPGSAQRLCLDGDYAANARDPAPVTFNVIDTSYLADRVGLLNILPHTVLALQTSASVLYTNTRVENVQQESKLLENMLCGDVGVMCTLFGVVPRPYLSGLTTQAYHQYFPRHHSLTPISNRITWRMTKAGDPILDFNAVKPVLDADEFAKFLRELYLRMFCPNATVACPHDNHPTTHYTIGAYAALLAFLHRRVTVNWKQCISKLFDLLSPDKDENIGLLHTLQDMTMHFALWGVYIDGVPPPEVYSRLPTLDLGVLKHKNTPDPCAVVLTIPRQKLQPIFDKTKSRSTPIPLRFQLFLQKATAHNHNKLSSVQPIFGKLITSADGESGTIEEDPKGWYGNSDLHICGYFPTLVMRLWEDYKVARVGATLVPDKEVLELFKDSLGDSLLVMMTCLDHGDMIHFFKSLPGLAKPDLKLSTFIPKNIAVSNTHFKVNFPRLDLGKKDFVTTINTVGGAHEALQNKEKISVHQISPNTLTVVFGNFRIQCNFLFPVDSATSRLRVSRVQGWIEVIAPLLTPTKRGLFASNPFPIIASREGMIHNLWLPYINFTQLPSLDRMRLERVDAPESIQDHLMAMFNNAEISRPQASAVNVKSKMILQSALFPSTRILRIIPTETSDFPIVFFIKNLYIDFNSHSIVGEAYVLNTTATTKNEVMSLRGAVDVKGYPQDMKWWRSVLPAMVESCRDFQHSPNCEYMKDLVGGKVICSCGETQLEMVTWWADRFPGGEFKPKVTRCALSPLFDAPYLEPTRREIPEVAATVENYYPPTRQDAQEIIDGKSGCNVCSKPKAKKCGRCMEVAYCSRECQVKDWKEHKKVCGVKPS